MGNKAPKSRATGSVKVAKTGLVVSGWYVRPAEGGQVEGLEVCPAHRGIRVTGRDVTPGKYSAFRVELRASELQGIVDAARLCGLVIR